MDAHVSANSISPDHPSPESDQSLDRKRKRRYWIWGIVLIVIGLLAYWLVAGNHAQNAQPAATARRALTGPVTVTSATAKKGDIGVYLNAIGTVTALYTVSITAQVTGVITRVYYKEGQFVQKGNSLIEIDPRLYEAQVIQAEGALARDQNVLAQSQMDLARYKEAWARNAIPRQTYEDQEKIVKQNEGLVKNDEGTLRYNQVQLAYCHITSPITGRVGLRLVDPGNLVTANATTTLVVITETQPITVVATISEDNLVEVMAQPQHGVNLPLEAWDRANQHKIATGKVISYDNQIDTTTGTLKLRAVYENKNGVLYANEFVNTRLLVKTLHDQILLPSSAIQHNGSEAFVYVIQNSQANIRDVKTGVSNEGLTAVEGVNEGEVVADSSFEKLQNGSKITISNAALPGSTNQETAP
jgi:membrane fusion protein, multidrug efflux system